MVNHKCNRCNKIFNHKGTYNRHMKRKNPCKILHDAVFLHDGIRMDIVTKSYICQYCEKHFSSISSMNRHIRCNCRSIKYTTDAEILTKNYNKLNQMFKVFKMEESLKKDKKIIRNLTKKIEKLEGNCTNITINNTNNSQNTITNNIQLNGFGFEKTDYLDTAEFIKKIKMMPNILGLLEYENRKNCDPNHSDNWNIGITNLKHDTCKIYKNQRWQTQKASETISNKFMKTISGLGEKMELIAHKRGRKVDKDGIILDKHEQNLLDNYDKATCYDVIDDFYVHKLKDAIDIHKKMIYDHTARFRQAFIDAGFFS